MIPWYSTSSSSFRYVSQIDCTNSPLSFVAQRSSISLLCWVEMSCLDFIRKNYCSHVFFFMGIYKKICLKWCRANSHWDASYLFLCHISNIKVVVLYEMMYTCLRDVLLKPSPPFIFFPQYAALLLDNLIKVFSPPLKTIDESLDFN